jgi:hypothetical protein
LIGLAVFSSDGSKVGTVDSVDGQPDGKITATNIKVGGFLGFGTKVVAIPEGKFNTPVPSCRLVCRPKTSASFERSRTRPDPASFI